MMETDGIQRGTLIDGKYLLKRCIGKGGICVVWEAEHRVTGSRVALKLLQPAYSVHQEAARRLAVEARAMTAIRHPNVVAVYDAGSCAANGPYLVMELLEGRTLSGILAARSTISLGHAVSVGLTLCEVLAQAHRVGIIHRDLKPANIFLARDRSGRELVKLFDFGVAAAPAGEQQKLTRDGNLVGTPEYMAPEQLLGDRVADERADQYGLAATLYEAVSGRPPRVGTLAQIVAATQAAEVEPLLCESGDATNPLDGVLARALRRDPDARFADMRAFADALEAARLPSSTPNLGTESRERNLDDAAETAAEDSARDSQTLLAIPRRSRRRHHRAPYMTLVRVMLDDGTHLDGRTEDISEGGMLVLSDRPSPSAEVSVKFALPVSGRITSVRAQARWVRRGRGAAMGLEFLDLDPAARQEIARYVAALGVAA